MQDDPSPDSGDVLRVSDSAVYGLLILPDEQRPWSVDELAQELGSPIDVEDALVRLYGAGLVHRCGEFVWATRAALAAEAMDL
jgi:predicted transcriptional regulator